MFFRDLRFKLRYPCMQPLRCRGGWCLGRPRELRRYTPVYDSEEDATMELNFYNGQEYGGCSGPWLAKPVWRWTST